ncbi:MAG TPA: hypothetical protein VGX91_14435 [Candidatus Cybelea sp.]|jgi:hypothetical protein|nr:hypothetical protein [Candidatus Cybelea sp.]
MKLRGQAGDVLDVNRTTCPAGARDPNGEQVGTTLSLYGYPRRGRPGKTLHATFDRPFGVAVSLAQR